MKNIVVIKENNFEKARKIIKEQKKLKNQIMFISENDDLNRKILEKEPIDILIIPQLNRKDRQKQRNSGFNQVLAKIAKKNKVIIGIYIDEILESKGIKKANILARIIQNIKLCSKNKIQMKFYGEKIRNIYDLKSLGLILGMPTWMTKNF